MTRLWMLDTNTVSYIVRGKSPAARTKLNRLQGDEIACISVITEAELRYGVSKQAPGSVRLAALNTLFDKLRILPWGSAEALVYGDLRAKLERAGKALGNLDMLIAAHAISANATLVTRDKAFVPVEDLRPPVNWAVDL
jgi:tRNA(fMet)-specific endonuclease VapC